MTSPTHIAATRRTTERIPTPSGEQIDAWLYLPEGDGPHPVVVMAHGFAAVKAGGVQPFAEGLPREGFAAIAFDYPGWGDPNRQPRQVRSVPHQRAHYQSVINLGASHPPVDTKQ